MAIIIFQANTKARNNEVNNNFSFLSGDRLIAFDPATGAAIDHFNIGDLSEIANGALVGDILARSGHELQVYNASGVLIGSVTYDNLLNLRSATELIEGTAKIATQIETDAGSNDTKFITPLKLANSFKPIFKAYRSTNQSITASTETLVQFDTEIFDPQNEYDNATNFRYTPQREGYYMIVARIGYTGISDVARLEVRIRKNGTVNDYGMITGRSENEQDLIMSNSAIIEMNGTTDYIDIAGFSINSGNMIGNIAKTNFAAFYIGGFKDV